MASKKMINTPTSTVSDCLSGLVASRSDLVLLENHNVVLRADLDVVRNKVALVSGGGSGHEPAHAGYVGQGMLTAAVCGNVFASPGIESIEAALLAIQSHEPSGILVIVKNYTGDRVNFGLAVERAKAAGIKCDMVIVAEDTALTSADKTAGRRGLAGTVFVHKVAGAMAEQGKNLEEICGFLSKSVLPQMGTIGLCLQPCSLPGQGPSFQLAADEVALGLGIHGEMGVRREKVREAKLEIETMIDHMTNPESATKLVLEKGQSVALMVNNLGSTSNIEMGVIVKESKAKLESLGVRVARIYAGHFMTALDMAGFSLTVLIANPSILELLDARCSSFGWSGASSSGETVDRKPVSDPKSGFVETRVKGPAVDKFGVEATKTAVDFACEAVISCSEVLNKFDSGAGDGDCGVTLKKGAAKMLEMLKGGQLDPEHPVTLLNTAADVAGKEMGGTSGAMFSLFFTAMAGTLQCAGNTNADTWFKALENGLSAIRKYGRADPGDRTLVDALHPAIEAFGSSLAAGDPIDSLEKATCAAEKGAMDTVDMTASAGRASYVSKEELKNPDPGAHAIGIIMRAVYQGVLKVAHQHGRK